MAGCPDGEDAGLDVEAGALGGASVAPGCVGAGLGLGLGTGVVAPHAAVTRAIATARLRTRIERSTCVGRFISVLRMRALYSRVPHRAGGPVRGG
jgi:hypothetical protein